MCSKNLCNYACLQCNFQCMCLLSCNCCRFCKQTWGFFGGNQSLYRMLSRFVRKLWNIKILRFFMILNARNSTNNKDDILFHYFVLLSKDWDLETSFNLQLWTDLFMSPVMMEQKVWHLICRLRHEIAIFTPCV